MSIEVEWARLIYLASTFFFKKPLYASRPGAPIHDWDFLPGPLTAACQLNRFTEKALKKLADQTAKAVRSGERPGILHWLELMHVGWSKVPRRISLDLLKWFLSDPDCLPLLHCARCGANFPRRPEDQLCACPSCLSGQTIWDNLSQLERGRVDGVGNEYVPKPSDQDILATPPEPKPTRVCRIPRHLHHIHEEG
jgi:hypothetical protein